MRPLDFLYEESIMTAESFHVVFIKSARPIAQVEPLDIPLF